MVVFSCEALRHFIDLISSQMKRLVSAGGIRWVCFFFHILYIIITNTFLAQAILGILF